MGQNLGWALARTLTLPLILTITLALCKASNPNPNPRVRAKLGNVQQELTSTISHSERKARQAQVAELTKQLADQTRKALTLALTPTQRPLGRDQGDVERRRPHLLEHVGVRSSHGGGRQHATPHSCLHHHLTRRALLALVGARPQPLHGAVRAPRHHPGRRRLRMTIILTYSVQTCHDWVRGRVRAKRRVGVGWGECRADRAP